MLQKEHFPKKKKTINGVKCSYLNPKIAIVFNDIHGTEDSLRVGMGCGELNGKGRPRNRSKTYSQFLKQRLAGKDNEEVYFFVQVEV